jgi:SAM-dependent methyltransferase
MMDAGTPAIGDAFGRLLLDCFEAAGADGDTTEIIERDDGFIGSGNARRYFASPLEWPPIELELLNRARGHVLDIGCGAGRHILELQGRGLNVTGLDTSPGAIEVSRRRGVRTVFQGRVDELAIGGETLFDCFLMLGNNLGLLQSAEAAPEMLAALAARARPGALILGTTIDPYDTAVPGHLAYHERNRQRGRMGGQVRMRVRHRELASEWFDYLMFSEQELAGLIGGTGWQAVEVLRDGPRIGAVLKRA